MCPICPICACRDHMSPGPNLLDRQMVAAMTIGVVQGGRVMDSLCVLHGDLAAALALHIVRLAGGAAATPAPTPKPTAPTADKPGKSN